MAAHSSILSWRIPWTKEPDELQSMGSQSWTQLSDYHSRFSYKLLDVPLFFSDLVKCLAKFSTSVGMGFPGSSVVKNPPANAGDSGSVSGLGRSSGEGNGNPLQYSCLENPMDRGAWWATESYLTEGLSMHAVDFMAEQKIRKRRKSRRTFNFFLQCIHWRNLYQLFHCLWVLKFLPFQRNPSPFLECDHQALQWLLLAEPLITCVHV